MSEPFIISARDDGTATRLISILNAFFLSDLLNNKNGPKFFWNDDFIPYVYGETIDIGNNFRDFNKSKIIGQSIEKKENIFSKEFIDNYFIENKYNYYTNDIFTQNNIHNDVLDLCYNTNLDLFLKDYFSKKFNYIYIHHGDLDKQLNGIDHKEYISKLSLFWKRIRFTDTIDKIKNKVLDCIKNIENNYIIIHIRSGDVIYDFANFRKFNLQGIYHATPYELALGIIKKLKNKNIFLVGDDLTSINKLVNYINKDNVKSVEYFRDSNSYSNLELLFFDLFFMSCAKSIFGTHSALVRLANMINPDIAYTNTYDVFKNSEQYNIIVNNINFLELSNCQQAFSYFHLFILGKKLNKDIELLKYYLLRSLEFDNENDKYRIHFIDCLFKQNKVKEADEMLSEFFKTRKQEYIKTLLLIGWEGVVYSEQFDSYLSNFNDNYKNICFVANNILKNNFGAAFRIRKSLSYMLGRCIFQYKFLLFLKPYLIINTYFKYRKNKNKLIELNLVPIRQCLDYNEAIKCKRHKSYKLGNSLLKAHKYWYIGGYFKFLFFDIFNILLQRNK